MKVIGLIGGVRWESSAEYYRVINQEVKSKPGPEHSAELVLYSVDFQPIAQLEHAERWDDLAALLGSVAKRLEGAGANLLFLASNTLHKIADEIQHCIDIPLLHIFRCLTLWLLMQRRQFRGH
jgi:aspartate racemase